MVLRVVVERVLVERRAGGMSTGPSSGAQPQSPSGFRSRDARGLRLPPLARLVHATVVLAAVGGTIAAVTLGAGVESADWVAFALLTACAATAQLFSVRLGRNHAFHTAVLFVAAGALLLPPELVVLMVVAQHLPDWIKERYAASIQTFNIANFAVNALAAWATAQAILHFSSAGRAQWALAGFAAAAVLVCTNHFLLATMLRVARGHSFRDSGLFSSASLATDLTLAGLGVALAALWEANPWIAPVLLAPIVLSQRSLTSLGLVRESEERLRAIFDSAAVGTALLDRDGRMIAANRALESLLGYGAAELAELPLRALTHPDDAAGELDLHAELLDGKRDEYRLEKRFIAKDGRAVWANVAVGLVRNADGHAEYGIATVEDITERREAEHAVRDSERRYRELFEHANDMIVIVDLDWRVVSVNSAFEHVLGYTREEARGMSMAELLTPEAQETARRQRDLKLSGGAERTTFEAEHVTKDGRRVLLEVSSRVLRENGEPVAIQGFARDVSERRRLEEELRQAQKMEAVGRLAGGIAHDFNNLLTAIGGYGGLALDRLKVGQTVERRDLEEIVRAAKRAAELTGQLLAFSRKQILQPKRVDVNELVRDLTRMLTRLIDADIEIRTDLERDLSAVKADPAQLEQVLLNLVVNARDAMPDGGRLTIATETVDVDGSGDDETVLPGRYVVLSVRDTGTGMDEDTRARLFEPFFTTKEVGKGTGLGLAMVYGFVKQSGGFVTVDTAPEQGTSFHIYLQPLDVEPFETGTLEPSAASSTPGSEVVLLVEDEEIVRKLIRQMLEQSGYRVVEARDGEEALRLAGDGLEHADLLLTDAVMPKLGGPALAERMAEAFPTLKVVFMSGYTEEAIVKDGVLRPGTRFLQKPFTAAQLERSVRSALDGTERAAA